MLSTVSGQLIIGASSSTSAEKLYLGKDMYITGYIKNLCTWRTMAASATPSTPVSCNAGEVLIAINYIPAPSDKGIAVCAGSKNGYCAYGTEQVPLSGQMLCCKLK
jgi:hypothetical protein